MTNVRNERLPNSTYKSNGDIPLPQIDKQYNLHKSIVEMHHVEHIRKFFDHKAECFTKDKLSQSYIITTFAEDELWNYVRETLEVTDEHKNEYQISMDDLRAMFYAYCQDPEFSPTLKYPKESWKVFEKEKRRELCSWLKQTPKSVFLSYAWKNFLSFSFIGTAAVFVWNSPVREQQKYFQAWQVINTAQNQSGTGGRNEALSYLNGGETIPILNWAAPKCKKDNTCLVGIKITGKEDMGVQGTANLNKVDLENANLKDAVLNKTSFREANLNNAKFPLADINGAVFEGAYLNGADFREAKNVKKANFKGANFCKTKFSDPKEGRPDCLSLSLFGRVIISF
jgi:Pentapeptide repeats (8 copies)